MDINNLNSNPLRHKKTVETVYIYCEYPNLSLIQVSTDRTVLTILIGET